MDEGSISSDVNAIAVCCDEERLEPKGKGLNLPVNLHSSLPLWS